MDSDHELYDLRHDYVEFMKYFYMAQRSGLSEDVAFNYAELLVANKMDRIKDKDNNYKIRFIIEHMKISLKLLKQYRNTFSDRIEFTKELDNFINFVIIPRIEETRLAKESKETKESISAKKIRMARQTDDEIASKQIEDDIASRAYARESTDYENRARREIDARLRVDTEPERVAREREGLERLLKYVTARNARRGGKKSKKRQKTRRHRK
jgi:G3E family GTPase